MWDIVGKVYQIPLYQLLGGKYRDAIRLYCDTDVEGRHDGLQMGKALKERMEMGFTFLKMDLGIGMLLSKEGMLTAPLGLLEEMQRYAPHVLNAQGGSVTADMVSHQKSYALATTAHPFTGIHITEKGLDYLEAYVRDVRSVIGYDIPLAVDQLRSCLRGRWHSVCQKNGKIQPCVD